MSTATATGYTGTFHGRAEEVSRVRRQVARYLDGCPVTDDAVLAASEFAANAVLHSGGHLQGAGHKWRPDASLYWSSARDHIDAHYRMDINEDR
jgi:hypothetical protein